MPTYRKPHKKPLPKRSRTRPIYGTGDDEGKYFNCWHCGFVCNSERDELGDSESEAGDEHLDAPNLCKPHSQLANSGAGVHLGGGIGGYHVALKFGADESTAETVVHLYKSDISRGCPFCGSTNWRGDY